jgi:hypothetical protein
MPPSDELRRSRTDPVALNRLLESWMLGDPTEQRETFDILRRSLDEDRSVGYKLFP